MAGGGIRPDCRVFEDLEMWLAMACGAMVTGFYYTWIDGLSWQEMGRQAFLKQMWTSACLHGDSGLLLPCAVKASLPASLGVSFWVKPSVCPGCAFCPRHLMVWAQFPCVTDWFMRGVSGKVPGLSPGSFGMNAV